MSFNDAQKGLIRKLALLNAVKHGGKANPGAIVGGVLGDFPSLKQVMKELMIEINSVVKDVNSLSLEKQKEELDNIAPGVLERKHEVNLFGFLNIKEGEKIRTAFPPGPEKYPHIGHAKALLMNFLLAKQYNGEFYLRFEDTNPDLVKKEFYQIMQDDFKWLGVKWDKLIFASDYMDLYYKHCEDLLRKGLAYVCTSSQEDIRKMRETGESLPERDSLPEDNLALWKAMAKMEKGKAVVLLKIDLKHKNSTMRDPIIFRIIDSEHARHGFKYRVWPNYDFQNAIMDGYFKITHRLRSKEFEMRNELQRYIQMLLGYKETKIYEFARFNLQGVESSGRIIRDKIANGELLGWDDPSLTTLAALRRRGFQPEAIKDFVVKTGITKSESTLTWDDLIMHNKRFLDEKVDRYFFVADPKLLKIKGAPKLEFELNLHPSKRRGGRKFVTAENFFVSANDLKSLKKGSIYRLIECLNFKYNGSGKGLFVDTAVNTFREKGVSMLHFLPENDFVEGSVLMSDKSIVKGYFEKGVLNLKEGDCVQFERFGFCRLDNKKELSFWFSH